MNVSCSAPCLPVRCLKRIGMICVGCTHLTNVLRFRQIPQDPNDASQPSKEPVVWTRRTSAPVLGVTPLEGVLGGGVAATSGGDEAGGGGEHGADAGCLIPDERGTPVDNV